MTENKSAGAVATNKGYWQAAVNYNYAFAGEGEGSGASVQLSRLFPDPAPVYVGPAIEFTYARLFGDRLLETHTGMSRLFQHEHQTVKGTALTARVGVMAYAPLEMGLKLEVNFLVGGERLFDRELQSDASGLSTPENTTHFSVKMGLALVQNLAWANDSLKDISYRIGVDWNMDTHLFPESYKDDLMSTYVVIAGMGYRF